MKKKLEFDWERTRLWSRNVLLQLAFKLFLQSKCRELGVKAIATLTHQGRANHGAYHIPYYSYRVIAWLSTRTSEGLVH